MPIKYRGTSLSNFWTYNFFLSLYFLSFVLLSFVTYSRLFYSSSWFTSLLLFVIYSCFVTLILLFLVRYSVWLLSFLSFNHGVLFFAVFIYFFLRLLELAPPF